MKNHVRAALTAILLILSASGLIGGGRAQAQDPLTMQNKPFSQSETNGYNQDLYAVRGAKIKPGGTADDPENLAGAGYNQHAIRSLYKMRSISLYCNEAQVVAKKGDLDRALVLFLQTLDLDKQLQCGQSREVLAGLADVYIAKGQNDKALEALRTCVYYLGRPMGQDEVLAKYALLLYQAGQLEEALKIYRLALEGLPMQKDDPIGALSVDETNVGTILLPFAVDLILARCGLGDDYYYGTVSGAVDYARAAVKLRPNTALGYYYLGMALQHLNRANGGKQPELEKEAQSDYDKADELGTHEIKKLVAAEPGRPIRSIMLRPQ